MDPQLTNEYYNNFNDFEKDESPERKPPITTTSSYNKSITVTRNSMSKTVAPNRRRVATAYGGPRKSILKNGPTFDESKPTISKSTAASKTFSSVPRSSVATRMEYEQLIDVMQNALSNKPDRNISFILFVIETFFLF